MNNLIKELKDKNQDYEFYPTTDAMLDVVCKDIKRNLENRSIDVLDIGAGTCKLFYKLKELDILGKYQIIEKSKILLERAPNEAFIVGTDFETTNLIDKKTEIIFCNPPYSQFKGWMKTILKYSYSKYIYLIVPQRWEKDEEIKNILDDRKISFEILDHTDFLDAERQARAVVDIIRFKVSRETSDPFDYWFKNEFNFKIQKDYIDKYEKQEKEEKEINELIIKKGIIEALTENYNYKSQKIFKNYKALFEMDPEVLEEVQIDKQKTLEILKDKYKNLKYFYWNKLFNNFNKIRDRLIKKIREQLFNTLSASTNVDFNEENIYAIVLWIIKQSKKYENEQLKTIFVKLSNKCNVKKYKSNQQTWGDEEWRFCNREEHTHYKLDYRIVVDNVSDYDDFINDLITIANCLGFYSQNQYFKKPYRSMFDEPLKEEGKIFLNNQDILMEWVHYKNNNLHLKLNQEFLKALNIIAGKAFGWVKNKTEAMQELNYSSDDVDNYYDSYHTIESTNVKNILLINNK